MTIGSCHTRGSSVISSTASVIGVLAVMASVHLSQGMPGGSVLELLLFNATAQQLWNDLSKMKIGSYSSRNQHSRRCHISNYHSAFPPCVTVSTHFIVHVWRQCPEINTTQSYSSRAFECSLSHGNQRLLFVISVRKRWLSNTFGVNAMERCFRTVSVHFIFLLMS